MSLVENVADVGGMLLQIGYYDWFVQSIILATIGSVITVALGFVAQVLISQVRFSRSEHRSQRPYVRQTKFSKYVTLLLSKTEVCTIFLDQQRESLGLWFVLICIPLLWFPMLWLRDSTQIVQPTVLASSSCVWWV